MSFLGCDNSILASLKIFLYLPVNMAFFLLYAQDIVIATPGRLIDLIEMNVCHLMEVSFVVRNNRLENQSANIISHCIKSGCVGKSDLLRLSHFLFSFEIVEFLVFDGGFEWDL